jgi:copper chaperone CopZ
MSEKKVTLKVSGWGCEGCSAATEDSLKKVKGVRSVSTNLDKGTADVVFDDSVASVRDLEKAVATAGYQVEH